MLDAQFLKMVKQVEGEYSEVLRNRQDRLKCENWVKKLCSLICCEKVPLLKNRNTYVRLLLRCLTDVGSLEGVFRKMPPESAQELKTLQKHEILEIEFAAKNAQARKRSGEAKRKQQE